MQACSSEQTAHSMVHVLCIQHQHLQTRPDEAYAGCIAVTSQTAGAERNSTCPLCCHYLQMLKMARAHQFQKVVTMVQAEKMMIDHR